MVAIQSWHGIGVTDRGRFYAALEAIGCRGPDESGTFELASGILGATRLRLWDEGAARQPWSRGNYSASFNGELFNLNELREILDAPGISEIEALVVGLTTIGSAFLDAVDGQFAGVVVDHETQTWMAFRDRWGQVPLYFAADESRVMITSTPAAMRELVGEGSWAVDPFGLMETACWWAPTPPVTAWKGIQQVRPGHVVEFRRGTAPKAVLWAHDLGLDSETEISDDDLVSELDSRLNESVRHRMRSSEEAITASLSGGVDSFLISAYAAQHGLRRTFGLVGRIGGDDHTSQLAIARCLGVTHEAVELTPIRIAESFQAEVRRIGVPIVRLAPVAMGLLAQEVSAQGYRICLSGEGADELFAGYDSFRILAAGTGAFGDTPWQSFGQAEFDAGRTAGAAYWKFASENSNGPLAARVGLARLVSRHTTFRSIELLEEQEQRAVTLLEHPRGSLEGLRQAELGRLLAGYLLPVQSDHAWANRAVEARFPWLSLEVARLGLGTPVRRLVEPGRGKVPIRQLGDEVSKQFSLPPIDFSKRAFRAELSTVMANPASAEIISDLCRRCPTEVMDVAAVLRLIRSCTERQRWSESHAVLVVLTASLGALCG